VIDRSLLVVAAGAWVGATLLLHELRWFRRVPLVGRLGPYAPGAPASRRSTGLSVASFVEVVGPLARWVGEVASTTMRIDDDLATRLARVHSPLDPTGFRIRQLSYAALAAVAGCAVALVSASPAVITLLLIFAAPLLAFLIPEQQLAAACARWQRRVFLELPVVTEQLGMLLSAGYSLGAALNRLADRGNGACGQDLRRVCAHVRYGATEVQALREWAELVRVDGVDRLVAVLALNQEAGDLGRLISDEARAIRRDAQRELIETIERRAQLVWIPVTVAALLPGTLFLVVPFLEAMRLFTNP
jgi:tight adherence protein C